MWRLALPRFIERKSLLAAALVTLTVVFGLQELRVLLTGLVFYIRDSLGAHTVIPGVYALALFLIAFLAARIYVVLGPKRALLLTSGGLALVRLAEQVIPWPVGDLGLSTIGTALFLLFIPTYLGSSGRSRSDDGMMGRGWSFAVGFLLGIALDTSIKGVFGTLDLSWQRGALTNVIVVAMVVLHGPVLVQVVRGTKERRDSRWRISEGVASGRPRADSFPAASAVPEHRTAGCPLGLGPTLGVPLANGGQRGRPGGGARSDVGTTALSLVCWSRVSGPARNSVRR